MEQLLKSRESYEKLIKEHQNKLYAYINNPEIFDNQGQFVEKFCSGYKAKDN